MYNTTSASTTDEDGSDGPDELPTIKEEEAEKLVEAVESIDMNYLTFLLRQPITPRTTSRFNILGSGNEQQQKKILNYLVCLRHGLERSSDIRKRIKFGKISHLVELLGRDERWPTRIFHGRCDGSAECQCDGAGKGCRRQRLFALALMKLKMLQEDQLLMKERFDIRYSSMLELQLYEKKDRQASRKAKSREKHNIGMRIVLPPLKNDERTLCTAEEDRTCISSVDSLSGPTDLLHLDHAQCQLLEDESKIEEEECVSDSHTASDPQEEEAVISSKEEEENTPPVNDKEVRDKVEEAEEQIAKEASAEEEDKPLERFDMAALLAKIRSSKATAVTKEESPANDPVSDQSPLIDEDKTVDKTETEFNDKNADVHDIPRKTKSKASSRRTSKTKKRRNEVIIEKEKKPSPVEPDQVELDLESQKWIGKLSLQMNKSSPMNDRSSIPSLSHIELSGESTTTTQTHLVQRVSSNSIPHSVPNLPKQFPFKLEYSSDLITWTEYKGRRGKSPIFTQILDEYVFQLGKEINTRYLRVSSYTKDVIRSSTLKAESTNKTTVKDEPSATALPEPPLEREQPSPPKEQTPPILTEWLEKSTPIDKVRRNSESTRKQRITPLRPERPESSISSYSDQQWGRSSTSSASFHIIRDNDFDDDDGDNNDDDRTVTSIQAEHVSKFEADLVVNIKKDSRTPVPHTPIQTTRKKAMFPSLTPTPVPSGSDIDETAEERRRRKRALNRRRAATQKLDAMKNAMSSVPRTNGDDEDGVSCDDFFGNSTSVERDFLHKYCIISGEQRQFYKYLYNMYEEDKVDDEPALPMDDALEAISIANNALVTDGMTNYIVTILRIVGVPIDQRIDLRTFMLLLAFSEKVVLLGDFFRLHLERIDYANLLSCVIRAKQMYKLLLRDEEKKRTIYVEDLLIELQAAHIPHNKGLFATLTNDKAMMDFLDYLAYFPLFILTHTNIIDSPVF